MQIAAKYLQEDIGLQGNINYKGVISFRSNQLKNGLDRIMHVFIVDSVHGEIRNSRDSDFFYITSENLKSYAHKINFLDDQIRLIQESKEILYAEIDLDSYLTE